MIAVEQPLWGQPPVQPPVVGSFELFGQPMASRLWHTVTDAKAYKQIRPPEGHKPSCFADGAPVYRNRNPRSRGAESLRGCLPRHGRYGTQGRENRREAPFGNDDPRKAPRSSPKSSEGKMGQALLAKVLLEEDCWRDVESCTEPTNMLFC